MNFNKEVRCDLMLKKEVIKYINSLRKNKYITEFSNKLKQNKFIVDFINKSRKNRYVLPTIAIVLCLIILGGITAIVKSSNRAKTSYKESIATNAAESDFYNGKYDEAIEEYTKMQEKDEWPIWNMKIAEIYSVKGEYTKSNEILQKAYQTRNKIIDTKNKKIDNLQEKDKELANYITFTCLMNGEYKKSIEYGEMFLQEDKSDKALLKIMFTAYLVNGNTDEAKKIIDNYHNESTTAIDLATLARMNMCVNNFDECFSLLKEAWDKDKNEIRVFDVIAQMAEYDKTSALDKVSKLQKKEPNELAYKMWTAKIYSMSKDTAEKADKLVEELSNEDVGNMNLNLIKANMYYSLEDTDNLNETLEETIKDNNNSSIGYRAAAWLAYDKESYDEAFKDCEKSVTKDRDYYDNYTFLIPKIMEKQDKSEGAESYFRTALYKEPLNYEMILKTAEYYGNVLKNSSQALYYYDLASKMNPKDSEVYYNMALIKVSTQRYDDAIDLLKKSISINGKNPKYHRSLGTVYINKEKNDNGIKEIRNAYNLDKNDIKTLNNAACYYISVEGDISRGMANLKAAYDGINGKTSTEEKETITENYDRVKSLSDAYNKRNGANLKVPDLKLFY